MPHTSLLELLVQDSMVPVFASIQSVMVQRIEIAHQLIVLTIGPYRNRRHCHEILERCFHDHLALDICDHRYHRILHQKLKQTRMRHCLTHSMLTLSSSSGSLLEDHLLCSLRYAIPGAVTDSLCYQPQVTQFPPYHPSCGPFILSC